MNYQAMTNIVAYLRKRYPAGCRVMLDRMEDLQAPPIGTLGTVHGVDDAGSIMVAWDNGSSLSVVFEADACHRMDEEAVVDQGKEAPKRTGSVYQKLKGIVESEQRNAESAKNLSDQKNASSE